jgi:hypothetical protein
MIQYLVQVELVDLDSPRTPFPKLELVTSAPERVINEWLVENDLPKLSSWNYSGKSGSNLPLHKGQLNTLFLQVRHAKSSVRLVITTHELVPVDPTTIL